MKARVLIAAAVTGEAGPLEKRLRGRRKADVGPRRSRTGLLAGLPVRLLVTGPGPANAVQALTAALERSRPALVVQVGCAGAFGQAGLRVGDLAVASEEIDAHLGIEPVDGSGVPAPLPFAVLPAAGGDSQPPGRYPLDPRLARRAQAAAARSLSADVACGPFVTVSTVTASDRTARRLHRRYGALMESMEGAGAAHVCRVYGLPLVEIRAASNRVGRRDRGAWELETAFARSAAAAEAFIAALKYDPADPGPTAWE